MLENLFHKVDDKYKSLFFPSSIAVVGASNDTKKIGGYIFSQILKVNSIKAYPINIKWEFVQGKKAYTSILDIKEVVDLVVIAIPKDYVLQTLNDCVNAGIKNVVIITAGFKEVDETGKEREEKIRQIVKENNMNLIGPNCLGFLNVNIGLNCSFAKDIPPSGDVALVSQSGAVIDGIIDWSFKKNIGFSKIISLGNMAGLSELDVLEYLKNDKNTKSIVFYMETLERGDEFAKIMKEVTKTKPVIIIKPGNSDLAKKAIGSHTGSLAQNNILVKTLIENGNGILASNMKELFNLIVGTQIKISENNSLMILTNAGGPGVIATDSLEKTKLKLYKLTDEQKKEFDFLPKESSLNNPIDILGDAKSDRYEKTLNQLERYNELGNILILLTPQIMTDTENIAKNIISFSRKTKKSISVCFLGDKEVSSAIKILDENKIPNFSTPSEATFTLNKMYKWKTFEYLDDFNSYEFPSEEIEKIKQELSGKSGLLSFEMTKRIFENILAIKLPNKKIINKIEDVENIILDDNKKYVIKVDSKNFIHKKELGGVLLGITKENFKEKVYSLFDELYEKSDVPFSITVEEEVKGYEVIVGLKSDEELGNFIMFGSGGTLVSIYKDVMWSKCPLSKSSVKALISKTRISKVLNGFRGSKPIYFEHLYEVMIRVSYLQKLFPMIKEVDLNPIIANETGVYLVDIKLIM